MFNESYMAVQAKTNINGYEAQEALDEIKRIKGELIIEDVPYSSKEILKKSSIRLRKILLEFIEINMEKMEKYLKGIIKNEENKVKEAEELANRITIEEDEKAKIAAKEAAERVNEMEEKAKEQLTELQRENSEELKMLKELHMKADPMTDVKRIGVSIVTVLQGDGKKMKDFVELLKNLVKDRDRLGKHRSAKNLILACVYISLDAEDTTLLRTKLHKLKNDGDYIITASKTLSVNTIKNFINYLDTDRFRINISFCYKIIKMMSMRAQIPVKGNSKRSKE